MADPINRLAMYAMPVADQVNMLVQPQLPPGHPSNMLMWVRDLIPQVQADDSSLASGIYSRLGRTATSIPRAGLETAANWLRGVNDPNAVRIGEDTIAPLGLGAFAGFAGKALAPSRDVRIARDLARRYPDEVAGGEMYYTGGRIGVADGSNRTWGWTEPGHGAEVSNARGGSVRITRPDPEVYGVAHNVNTRGPHAVLADNAKASVPGTVVNGLDMSQEARMGRAREQGFDTSRTWHHGTDAEFDAFQARPAPPYSGGSSVPAIWLTSSPRVAGAFAEAGGQPGRVIDTHIAAPNLEVVERGFRSPNWDTMDPILQQAREAGKDGVLFKRSNDHPDTRAVDPRVWNASDVVAMFNPSNIRSTQAAFDPAKRNSANLLAADNAKSSVPGTAANATQEDSPVLSILSKYGLY